MRLPGFIPGSICLVAFTKPGQFVSCSRCSFVSSHVLVGLHALKSHGLSAKRRSRELRSQKPDTSPRQLDDSRQLRAFAIAGLSCLYIGFILKLRSPRDTFCPNFQHATSQVTIQEAELYSNSLKTFGKISGWCLKTVTQNLRATHRFTA